MNEFPHLSTRYSRALLEQRDRVATSGTFRERVRFDLVDRPHHAFGLLAAADVASFVGAGKFTAIEFGVAEGAGLLNLASIASAVTEETGIEIELVGFDSGEGLPAPEDFRDHPEIWSAGDFAMPDPDALRSRLPGDVRLILGRVAASVPEFVAARPEAPIGFVSFDLDYYSSTRDALTLFGLEPPHLLPVVMTYFDDVIGGLRRIGSLFRNRAGGQLRAIDEFNEKHDSRIIDEIRVLRHRRPLDREMWLDRMYALHVLDHPIRSGRADRGALSMTEHRKTSGLEWPL